MAMTLEEGINQAIAFSPAPRSARASFVIAMHEDSGLVLYGRAEPEFEPDVALRDAGPATIDRSPTAGIGGWFTRQPAPGFVTPAPSPGPIAHYFLPSDQFKPAIPIAYFAVRRDPGVPILQWVRGGPSVQIEIEASGNLVSLSAKEDGVFVRAVGSSVMNPSRRAYYIATLQSTIPIIP
jgi:hypothetical protein